MDRLSNNAFLMIIAIELLPAVILLLLIFRLTKRLNAKHAEWSAEQQRRENNDSDVYTH